MKQIVFTLLLMAAAFQGYSKNSLREETAFLPSEVILNSNAALQIFDDCRITMRASIGFITVEVSVSAPTCRGAFSEAIEALRDAAASAREAIK